MMLESFWFRCWRLSIKLSQGLFFLLLGSLMSLSGKSTKAQTLQIESRPFHLGFTRWPADLTLAGVKMAEDFAIAHGDLISEMFIGGIPWPEALEGRPYSPDVQKRLASRPPAPKTLFLSISPLDQNREKLAPYWGQKDNLPLPAEWAELALDSDEVKTAYTKFVLDATTGMRPDFLAIGIESNVLLSKDARGWEQFKALYRHTRQAVKAKYPELPICFTTEVLHYKQLASEAVGSRQEAEVATLMQASDLFAMSIYPHMSYGVPRPIPADFFDFATEFDKPIAVAESGMTSRDVELKSFNLTLRGSPADQQQFTELLLSTAARDCYVFVTTFATTDFEKLADALPPPVNDIARIWAYTGLQTSSGEPKPALDVWDAYYHAKYRRE